MVYGDPPMTQKKKSYGSHEDRLFVAFHAFSLEASVCKLTARDTTEHRQNKLI